MKRMVLCVALATACSSNPSTGAASLSVNSTPSAKSAWIEPTHAGYTIMGTQTNFLGWQVRFTDASQGTECTTDLSAIANIKIITPDVETAMHTRADLPINMVPVIAKLPDNGVMTTIAVVSTKDNTALINNGIITITKVTATEVDGSIIASGQSATGSLDLQGEFFATKCFN